MAIVVDIILVVLFVLTVWSGYRRGILKTAVRLVLFVGAVLVSKFTATALAPTLASALPMPGIGTKLASYLNINFKAGESDLAEVLSDWGIPQAAAEKIERYFERSAENVGESVSRQLTPELDKLLAEAIVFVFLVILLCISASLITSLLDRAIEFPIISSVDKACGLAAGIVIGALMLAVTTYTVRWLFPLLDAGLDLELTKSFAERSFLIRMFNSVNPLNGLLG